MATLTSNRMCAPRSQGDISTRFFFFTRNGDYSLCTHTSRQLQISHALSCKNAAMSRTRLWLFEGATNENLEQSLSPWKWLKWGSGKSTRTPPIVLHSVPNPMCHKFKRDIESFAIRFCRSQHVNFHFFLLRARIAKWISIWQQKKCIQNKTKISFAASDAWQTMTYTKFKALFFSCETYCGA